MKLFLSRVFLPGVALLFLSCASAIYKDMYPTLLDGRYDSEFPYRGCSKQLEEISESVRRITVMAHYKTYSFSESDSITAAHITKRFLESHESTATFQHLSTAGTGTVLCASNRKIAVLTCAHLVNYEDTVTTRFLGSNFKPSRFIRSLSVRMTQSAYLNEVVGESSLEILAIDRTADLAVLGQEVAENRSIAVHEFSYPAGRAKDLEWGSFVYVFGYPSGYQVVTKGIVSLSKRPPEGSFVIDVVTSPGSSGSPALAIRDGVPNFELVGIIKMIPAQMTQFLGPEKPEDIEYDPLEPYHGEVFVQKKLEMQPGIAVAIPVEKIISFLKEHERRLAEKGYDISGWLRTDTSSSQ